MRILREHCVHCCVSGGGAGVGHMQVCSDACLSAWFKTPAPWTNRQNVKQLVNFNFESNFSLY